MTSRLLFCLWSASLCGALLACGGEAQERDDSAQPVCDTALPVTWSNWGEGFVPIAMGLQKAFSLIRRNKSCSPQPRSFEWLSTTRPCLRRAGCAKKKWFFLKPGWAVFRRSLQVYQE